MKAYKRKVSKKNIVTTHGYTFNGAALGSGSVSANIAQDAKGNIALQVSVGGGGGTPCAGISSVQGVMFAPDITALEGEGAQYGGSVVAGCSVGAEYLNSFQKNGQVYHGFNISGGVGISPPIEMHGEGTFTKTIFKFNVYDQMQKIYIKIMDW